jgi:hypothetical protein
VDTPKRAKKREEPFMARRKQLSERAKSGLGQASDPATQEVTSVSSSTVNEAPIAETTLAPENLFSDSSAGGVMDRPDVQQGAFDEVSPVMPEVSRPEIQQAEAMDEDEKVATEQRAEVTASTAESPASVRNPIVASGWPRAVGWGGFGALAFYYGYGYPYYGYAYNPAAYNQPGAGYGHAFYGLRYPGWYWR